MNAPAICQSYDEARQAFQDGELQAWDGRSRWVDIPFGSGVFFAREVGDYRRKPKSAGEAFLVVGFDVNRTRIIRGYGSAKAAADSLWEQPLADVTVFKRVDIQSLDIKKIEEQLEYACR